MYRNASAGKWFCSKSQEYGSFRLSDDVYDDEMNEDQVFPGSESISGDHDIRLYRIWHGMKHRCKKDPRYHGRGIRVCPQWSRDFIAFEQWSKSNGYDVSCQIHRKHNDKGYAPANCQWVTPQEHARLHSVMRRTTRECNQLSGNL